MANYERGYYISGFGSGGAHGPKAKELSEKAYAETPENACPLYGASSLSVDLVYGNPVVGEFDMEIVRPVEKAYGLLRYYDPEEQHTIYITRFDPAKTVWGADEFATPVPVTPGLNRIFDELQPEWVKGIERYDRRKFCAWNKAIALSGLERPPKLPENHSREEWDEHCQSFHIFRSEVLKYIKIPRPFFVRVDGIDDVLEKIDISPLPERFRTAS